jgi:hypothetical protein
MTQNQFIHYYAEYFYNLGLNISYISTIPTKLNFMFDPKKLKAPSYVWEPFTSHRQSHEIFSSYDWSAALGFGLVLGYDGIFAIDIDGSVDDSILKKVLELLNLPLHYPWVTVTGSQSGYHIILKTKLPDKNWIRSPFYKLSNGIGKIKNIDLDFGKIDVNTYYPGYKHLRTSFCKIEFKWKGHVVLPPSNHASGRLYKFLNKIPDSPPEFIEFGKMDELQKQICGDITLGSGNEEKQISPADIQHTSNVFQSAIVISINVEANSNGKQSREETIDKGITQISWAKCKIVEESLFQEFDYYNEICQLYLINREVRTINFDNESVENYLFTDENGLSVINTESTYNIKTVILDLINYISNSNVLIGFQLENEIEILKNEMIKCGLHDYTEIFSNKKIYDISKISSAYNLKSRDIKLSNLYKGIFKQNLKLEFNAMFNLFTIIHCFNKSQYFLVEIDNKELDQLIDDSFKIPDWEKTWNDRADLLNHTTNFHKVRRLTI